MPIEPGALNQAHDRSRTLARPQRASEQPVFSTNRDGPDLVLRPVVVDWQLSVIQETRERAPALEAVIERSGRGRAVGDLPALQSHPLMKRVGQWPGAGLAYSQPLIGRQAFNLALDVIQRTDVAQRLRCDLALVARMQLKELSPRMRHTACLSHAQGK